MDVFAHLARLPAARRPRVVAVGQFDGVHLGHLRVLQRLREVALRQDGDGIVALIMRPRPRALTTLRQRLSLLRTHGIGSTVVVGPREPHDLSAILARIEAAVLVSGAPEPEGSCSVERVELVRSGDGPVSSAAIRALLARGDLDAVARDLGRSYAIEGRVVHGFHRGARLGIPTANLRVANIALPPDGVYAVRATVHGRPLDGVANIGRNPTFDNEQRSIETHLFDFAGDIYGVRLEVAFVACLRGEQKFPGPEALVAQIHADIAAARAVLAHHDGR